MRFSLWLWGGVSLLWSFSVQAQSTCDASSLSSSFGKSEKAPLFVDARRFDYEKEKVAVVEKGGDNLEAVFGCCSSSEIGSMHQMSREESLQVLLDAKTIGWQGGLGEWPQMSLQRRLKCVETFVEKLREAREQIIQVLMWEIGKNGKDAAAEFDRTIDFIHQIMDQVRTHDQMGAAKFTSVTSSVRALVRRAALGIVLCLGPFNYPLNETYAAMIPALLMGNIVILKLPTVGGLAHLLTMDAFLQSFPPHTVNFISGRGRETMPPLMETGHVDALAFIGSSRAADNLIKSHPHPHKLKLFLQLEAKNMGIFLQDLVDNHSLMHNALDQSVLGSLSYNGQRCTALKLFFVPRQHGSQIAHEIAQRVDQLTIGMPWDNDPNITPLPNPSRIQYMNGLIQDALDKGAKIINSNGGQIIGQDTTLMVPAVLYPVTPNMRIYKEEQFGPVVPIVEYDDLDPVLEYATEGTYAQQVSIFTSGTSPESSGLIDAFSNIFGKININSQCGRSPDTLPFSGRRSSALGVMSVTDVLNEFSIPTVVSYKPNLNNQQMMEQSIQPHSSFLSNLDTQQ